MLEIIFTRKVNDLPEEIIVALSDVIIVTTDSSDAPDIVVVASPMTSGSSVVDTNTYVSAARFLTNKLLENKRKVFIFKTFSRQVIL